MGGVRFGRLHGAKDGPAGSSPARGDFFVGCAARKLAPGGSTALRACGMARTAAHNLQLVLGWVYLSLTCGGVRAVVFIDGLSGVRGLTRGMRNRV